MKTSFYALSKIRLLNGPLGRIAHVHAHYLMDEIDPDRLLAPFLEQAGLPPKRERYREWELSSLAGHSLGHYLSAVARLYAGSGRRAVQERIQYLVSELARCQQANGDGYGLPMNKSGFTDLASGKIEVQPFQLNGLWAPYYVVHKVLAGLLDAKVYAAVDEAAEVGGGLVGFLLRQVENLDAAQVRQMLVCEHGGIYEVMLAWSELLRRPDWLAVARRAFYDATVLDPIKHRQDRLNGKHCNTLIPKILGMAKNYELAGAPDDAAAADFFFRQVTGRRCFTNGSFGDSEHFFPVGAESRHLTPWTGEGCNTYNMLKLAKYLFQWQGRKSIIDYVERTLINHVAANIGRHGGEFGYFLGLGSLGCKILSRPQGGWWCCVGTGLENPVRYGELAYSRRPDGVAVNLYFASRLKAEEWGLTLTNRTNFPLGETAEFTLRLKSPRNFTLAFRQPDWCDRMTLTVNGRRSTPKLQAGYFPVKRNWKDGDIVRVALPFELHMVPLRGKSSIRALQYGPLLLAGVVPLPKNAVNEAAMRWEGHIDARGKIDGVAPVITAATEQELKDGLIPQKAFGCFRSRGLVKPHDLKFKPFFSVYNEYYAIYFLMMSATSWRRRRKQLQRTAEQQRLAALRRVDEVHPGFQQSEVDHQFAGVQTDTGESLFRKWRKAQPGGYFRYTLKCVTGTPLELVVTTYGGEWVDQNYRHHVTIFVQDVKIAELHPDNSRPGEWVDHVCPIPPKLLAGKSSGEFRFEAASEQDTGRIFGLELRKTEMKQP